MCEPIEEQTAIVELNDSQAYVIFKKEGKFDIKVFKNDAVWGVIGSCDTFHEAETLIASLIHFCDDETGNVHIIEFNELLKTVKASIVEEN
jgi:hypothetical protein